MGENTAESTTDNESGRSPAFVTHPVTESYQRWILDILIVLAGGIFEHYQDDPRRYADLADSDVGMLSRARSTNRAFADVPDTPERTRYYSSRFGYSFWTAGAEVRQAAIAIVEHPTSRQAHVQLQVLQDAASVLRAHLNTVSDKTSVASDSRISDLFDQSVALFKSQAIAQVFSAKTVSTENWPYDKAADGDAAYLVEMVAKEQGYLPQQLDQMKFLGLQRVAYYGGHTIADVLHTGEGDDLDVLIGNAYGWAKALQTFVPDIVRAWKVPQYRKSLGDLERSMVPDNPAGNVDLGLSGLDVSAVAYEDATVMEAAGTYTVSGEVCCCDTIKLCDTYAPICDPLKSLTGLCWPF